MIYFSIFILLSLAGLFLQANQQRALLVPLLVFLFLFMGLRDTVGCDWTGYLNRFKFSNTYRSIYETMTASEPFFESLTLLVKRNRLEYHWLNIICTAFMMPGIFLLAKQSRYPLIFIACLFPVIILQLMMSGIRQGVAVAMLMGAAASFLQHKSVRCGIWIVLGAMFHTSLAAFLPIAYLAGKRVSFGRIIAGTVILAPVAAYLLQDRAGDYADQYVYQLYGEISSGGAWFRYIALFVPVALFIYLRKRIEALAPEKRELFRLFSLITLLLIPIGLISNMALHRMTFYVMPITILLFVELDAMSSQRWAKLMRIAPVLIFGVYLLSWLLLSKHASLCYSPYKNLLFS